MQLNKDIVDRMADAPRSAALGLERLAYGLLSQTGDTDRAMAERLGR